MNKRSLTIQRKSKLSFSTTNSKNSAGLIRPLLPPDSFEFSWKKREKQKGGDSIDSLELPTLIWNCLRRSQIDTVQELLELTPKDVRGIKNLGRVSVDAIRKALLELGYASPNWK